MEHNYAWAQEATLEGAMRLAVLHKGVLHWLDGDDQAPPPQVFVSGKRWMPVMIDARCPADMPLLPVEAWLGEEWQEPVQWLEINDSQGVLLLSVDQEHQDPVRLVHQLMTRILYEARTEDVRMVAVVGAPMEAMSGDERHELMMAMGRRIDLRFYLSESDVLTLCDLPTRDLGSVQEVDAEYSLTRDCIHRGDMINGWASVQALWTALIRTHSLSTLYTKSMFTSLVREWLQKSGRGDFEVITSALERIMMCQDLKKIRGILEDIMRPDVEASDEAGEIPEITRVAELIEQKYKTPLTLELLAIQTGWTPGYLSFAFRMAVGEGVPEYLNRVRLLAALRLLHKRMARPSDVHSRVGYSSRERFERVFTNVTGVSPEMFYQLLKQ